MPRRIPKIIVSPKQVNTTGVSKVRRTIRPVKTRDKGTPVPFPISLRKFTTPHISSNRIFIIGGGPSIKNEDLGLLKDEDTMCVNASINYVINPTYFVTMDYSFFDPKRKLGTVQETVKKAKHSYFFLNTNNPHIKTMNGKVTDTRMNFVYYDLDKFSGVLYSKDVIAEKGFATNPSLAAHGDNSGFCAIQLAILMGYEEIYLIGFDLSVSDQTHFHQRYGSTSNIRKKIDQYNDSLHSAIKKYNLSDIKNKSNIQTITPSRLEDLVLRTNLKKVLSTPVKKITKKDYVIVSYYTIDTPYEQEAAKLRASLQRLNIPHDIIGIKNLGDWQANTRFKAKFMREMLDKHIDKSIVWVDSDAIIHSYPFLFDNYHYDVAVRWQDFRWRKNECLSGTIYMANNLETRELCKRWEGANIAEGPNAKTFEQWNLGSAIEEMRNSGKIKDGNLPPEYTMIFDSMRAMYPKTIPIIEHFQASRKLKSKVKKR